MMMPLIDELIEQATETIYEITFAAVARSFVKGFLLI
jgi:hypothetical protein